MDKLPIELLTLIAIFACTDGGPTGCALSLVSKRIRDVTRPARFFTVCVFSDPAKIDQFLRCYEAERARATDALPRVRHLCLSLMRTGNQAGPGAGPTRMPLAPTSTQPPTTREEFLAAMQRKTQQWRSAQDSLDEQYNRVVPALIRAVAPDVRTFALVQAQWRSATVVRCPFPPCGSSRSSAATRAFSPSPSRLRAAPLPRSAQAPSHSRVRGRDVDFTQWAAHAPNVTHLRVSRLGALPRITVDSLNTVMKDQDECPYFPKLEHAMIEPHQAPPAPGTKLEQSPRRTSCSGTSSHTSTAWQIGRESASRSCLPLQIHLSHLREWILITCAS
ncbi:uncharacterized protein BXZ73DRAFT_102359 [Epithele typhae]|uniref:uncharacterized protein n=1 Tax=Epithele typhae TaxID=378194 RepID=UPI002007AE14|nr:uncharacterized protein BXZ73DRAFT_102359 [Epithele typhae]KAH9928520.1 hypothetical protein BXZ73DRAFT_102359 [Epithele typhae]